MPLLEARHIAKVYGDTPALRGVSVSVDDGEVVALLGPSGCGKTTLLRIVAGLEAPDEGALLFEGRDLAGVPAHRRGFGLMFQDYALFPHKDVFENVAFGLRARGASREAIGRRVAELLDLVALPGYERRRVYELSGGERQRVALARSLAPGPRLLMLDEPLAALDRALRERLQEELARLLRVVGVASLYVTHDQQEALALAGRVVLMNAGRVEQQGTPEQVYRHPASAWVARFLGLGTLIAGRVLPGGGVDTPLGALALPEPVGLAPGSALRLLIRPDAALPPDRPNALLVSGALAGCTFRGSHYRCELRHASGAELALDMATLPGALGDEVAVALDPGKMQVLPNDR
jgi:ABC-type Fe3+/spermidine/putrescine transport system ATPase subunit